MRSRAEHHPRIGIFWFLNTKLLSLVLPLEEGTTVGAFVDCPQNHADYWATFQRLLSPRLRGLEYFEIPRGRVLFNKESGSSVVYLDKVLMKPKFTDKIRKRFQLPKPYTRFRSDPHYTTDRKELNKLFQQ